MYKFLICAGLLLFAPPTLQAQQTDELLFETGRPGIDEKLPDPPHITNGVIAPDLLKNTSFLNRKNVFISRVLTGRRRGSILVHDGITELVSAGFKRNNLHGVWQSRYDDGNKLDSGNFYNNIPDGEWRSWYKNGIIRSIRTYNAFKWNAIQSEISRGNTRFYNYRLSTMLSFRPRNFQSATNASTSFSSLPAEKIKYQPPFRYCLHHGLYMNFYSSGAIKDSGYYDSGLRDGQWNEYYTNGVISASGSYFRGAKNGGWKFMDRDGKLVMLAEYKNGKLFYRKTYSGQHR